MSFDVQKVRQDFPLLAEDPVVYLDNGATTLKPRTVIAAINDYYTGYSANIHRGLHRLSQKATAQYEKTRTLVQKWINADEGEIVFTSGTTAALNLIATCYGSLLQPGDEVILSAQEHHSNIVPWQLLAERRGVIIKVIPVNERGELQWRELPKLLSPQTQIVSLVHVSNSLGLVNPIADIAALVKKHSRAVLVVDGAQGVAHFPVDVQELGVDFYCFSSHKLFGPTGVGVLYGKMQWLEAMPPFLGGGDMIEEVDFAGTTFAPPPQKFEAGTPHIAGVIGLGAAIEYLQTLGMDAIAAYEKTLNDYGLEHLGCIPGLKILGAEAPMRVALFSFVMEGAHPQDLALILDRKGIAVRTGHHCAWPLLKSLGVDSTTRAALAMYNTTDDIDRLATALTEAKEILL